MRLKLMLGASVGLLAMGCSKDICDRSAKWSDDCDIEYTDAEMDACKDSIADCDKADNKILNKYYDCLEDADLFGTCDTSTTLTTGEFYDSFDAMMLCIEPLDELTDPCLEGMMYGYSSTYYYYYTTYYTSY